MALLKVIDTAQHTRYWLGRCLRMWVASIGT
jgi:hypothetical protein